MSVCLLPNVLVRRPSWVLDSSRDVYWPPRNEGGNIHGCKPRGVRILLNSPQKEGTEISVGDLMNLRLSRKTLFH